MEIPVPRPITFSVDKNGCHICTSHAFRKSDGGYFKIQINRKQYFIHRYLYEQKYGPIPTGLILRHKCDNNLCINVDHLEIGTHQDNVRDRVSRNRSAKGEKNGRSKLTDEQIHIIRSSTKTAKDLADEFKVGSDYIYKLRKNSRR